MRKIAIVTLFGYENYGNRFQNFALQQVLEQLDFEVTTLFCDCQDIERIERLLDIFVTNTVVDAIAITCHVIVNKIKRKINSICRAETRKNQGEEHNKVQQLKLTRINRFHDFIKNTTHITKLRKISSLLPHENIDYFVVGSDQVWNPSFGLPDPYDFLSFAPEKKRISYSASFGVSCIPKRLISRYRKGLNGISHVSVREEDGAEIVKELTGRDVPVLVDPTMMLDAEDWRKIAKPIKKMPESNYLLTFFLGEVSNERRKTIKDIADKEGFIIINLNDIFDPERYVIAPDEFISYIDNASFIVTDSFHGTVFSILFNKPFIVFDRIEPSQTKATSMHSRIETLLSKFKLEDRYEGNIDNCKNLFEADYSHVPAILEVEREKAYKFLREALGN